MAVLFLLQLWDTEGSGPAVGFVDKKSLVILIEISVERCRQRTKEAVLAMVCYRVDVDEVATPVKQRFVKCFPRWGQLCRNRKLRQHSRNGKLDRSEEESLLWKSPVQRGNTIAAQGTLAVSPRQAPFLSCNKRVGHRQRGREAVLLGSY